MKNTKDIIIKSSLYTPFIFSHHKDVASYMKSAGFCSKTKGFLHTVRDGSVSLGVDSHTDDVSILSNDLHLEQ